VGGQADDAKGPKDTTKATLAARAAWIGIGAGVGLVFGVLTDNVAVGLACGAALGTVVFAVLESSRKRQ
jgi:uncharacterized membrane protein YphA (DoxX/SURF4 family)